MNIHQHARMTVHGRALLVNRIIALRWRVAEAAGVSERTAYKWRRPRDLGYPHELWTTRLLAGHVREHGPHRGLPHRREKRP